MISLIPCDSTMLIPVIIFFLILSSPVGAAVPVDECFNCHEDFKKRTLHGSIACTDCHNDIKEIPHEEKLARPSCDACHNKTVKRYSASIHSSKGLACDNCHEVHGKKGGADCVSCHPNVAHKTLPSRAKHLATLNCVACHSKLDKSGITVTVKLPKGASLERKVVDHDGNGFVDPAEWHAFEALLDQKFKGFTLERQYWANGGGHEVMPRAADCGECHEKRTRFATAVARITDVATNYSIQISPGIFIPEFPSLREFPKTVHGQKGIRCTDCHTSQKKITDKVCLHCHQQVYHTYENSIHAKKGATSCTDCHNPHLIKTYKEFNAKERIAICSRCHKDYITRHEWLPNTTLHFDYLECTTCHSPGSEKSMVFFFANKEGKKKNALQYEALERVFGQNVNLKAVINTYAENMVKSEEIGRFLVDLKKKMGEGVFIDAEIIVTKVHHDYSVTRLKEKDCVTCHSPQAHFYNSMYLILPEKERHVYVPVKGTLLSAYPIGMALDIYLLGEEKITKDDIYALFGKAAPGSSAYAKSLGFKLIDLAGVILIILVILSILVHALMRILVKR
jgi:predicted CXXCH cytochrome family protein